MLQNLTEQFDEFLLLAYDANQIVILAQLTDHEDALFGFLQEALE